MGWLRRWAGVCLALVLLLGASGCTPAGAPGFDQGAAPYAERVVVRGYRVLLDRPVVESDRSYWQPRVVEAGSALWFVKAMAQSPEYQQGLGRLATGPFIETAYRRGMGRAPTADELALWTQALADRPSSRPEMLAWLIEDGFTYRLARPVAVTGCRKFTRSGLRPVCAGGTAGDQRGVSIANVPGTNIYVNKAWLVEMDGFVQAARAKGYELQGALDPAVPDWMFSPGSWRSWDDQQWLYDHGYPANPPGRSMHEWGLAVDFDCNGQDITTVRACWDWARANGPRFGVYLFHTVDDPRDSEAWHFSSNGV